MEFDDTIKKISEILINIGEALGINDYIQSDIFKTKSNRYQISLEKQARGLMRVVVFSETDKENSFYVFFPLRDGEDKIYFAAFQHLINDNEKVANECYFWLNKVLIDIL